MSKISADTFEDKSAGETVDSQYVVHGTAKYWVQHTNAAVINDSLNVSSGTDNGTGDYDVNLTSAFSGTTFAIVGSWNALTFSQNSLGHQAISASEINIDACESGARTDIFSPHYHAGFGDLA